MTTNRILINKSGRSLPVYNKARSKKLGDIYNGELYVGLNNFDTLDGRQQIAFRAPNGAWRYWDAYVWPEWGKVSSQLRLAFDSAHSSGWQVHSTRNSVSSIKGFVFPVRSTVFVYNNTRLYTYLNRGDMVMTPAGNSRSGSTYENRLEIIGYRRAGVWYMVPALNGQSGWVDTGISSSGTMKGQLRVYSTKW